MNEKDEVVLLRQLATVAADVRLMETDLAQAKIKRNKLLTNALAAGIPAATVARFAGLTPGRVSQMSGDGREEAND